MAQGTYYFDAATFASATAVFTDSDLTICAADGYYSDGVISRQLVNCVLLDAVVCPDCGGSPTPPALVFTCAIASLSINNGTVGNAVTGSVVNGTIQGGFTPSTYSLGTNAYTASVLAPAPYTNAGVTIGPCSANAVGSSVPIVPQPTLVYYYLRGCQNAAGNVPGNGYKNLTTAPGNSQRFLDGNSGDFWTHDSNQPTVSSTTDTVPSTTQIVAGAFGCPDVTRNGYLLQRCSDLNSNFFFITNDSFATAQRVESAGVSYIINGIYGGGGQSEVPNVTAVSPLVIGCPALPPTPVPFTCSDAVLTISDGIVGNLVEAQTANGTVVLSSISPNTYQAGTTTYNANIEVTVTSVVRGGEDVEVSNPNALVPCQAQGLGEVITPILNMSPNSINYPGGYADNRILNITANGPWALTFSGGGTPSKTGQYFSVSQSSGTGNASVSLLYNGGVNGWANSGFVELRAGNAFGSIEDTTALTIQIEGPA
jgi:hypothetical protein|tara:strand:+ start:7274 stop:8722 length:1449 start_codon:yes stop_codon:yes gene_type:complete